MIAFASTSTIVAASTRMNAARSRHGWARALFLSSSVSAVSHAADVSGSVLGIGTKGRIYRAGSCALYGRIFGLATRPQTRRRICQFNPISVAFAQL